jgi:PTH1 family peptidyl-tRNA hydrolase
VAEEAIQPLTIIGLGNPGVKYVRTRHNLGFMVVEELAKQLGWQFKADKNLNCLMASGRIGNRKVDLILPQTFMNESGWTIRRYLDYYKMPTAEMIVVCDDTALPFGQLRLRSS